MWLRVWIVLLCWHVAREAEGGAVRFCGKGDIYGFCRLETECEYEERVFLRERLGIMFKSGVKCGKIEVCCTNPSAQPVSESEEPEEPQGGPTLPSESLRCGQSNPDPSVKAQNPTQENSNFAEYPWTIRLTRNGVQLVEGLEACGGSLIHPQVVLTAGHCLDKVPKEELEITAGEWELNSEYEPKRSQIGQAKKIIIHQKADFTHVKNDIALIILEEPFQLADNVNTICLTPQLGDTDACIASGWGKVGEQETTVMKKVRVPVVKPAQCQKALRTTRLGKYFILDKSFMCAGGETKEDTCVGDGGGPLVCPSRDGDYMQVGIVSWGIGCGDIGIPGVYTNVDMFLPWIKNTVQAELGENLE